MPKRILGLVVVVLAACEATEPTRVQVGALRVTATTQGPSPDTNGYVLFLAGRDSIAIPSSGAVVIDSLPQGEVRPGLAGIANNCLLFDAPPATIRITAEDTTDVHLDVRCTPRTGVLHVAIVTEGAALDSNGYTLHLPGRSGIGLPTNGTVTLDVDEGDVPVLVTDVASNCRVTGPLPAAIRIVYRDTTEVAFLVRCSRRGLPGIHEILFVMRDSLTFKWQLYTILSDGTELRRVTTDTANEVAPSWSPDGLRIAYSRNGRLHIMDADGSNRRALVNEVLVLATDWSRDGARIALCRVFLAARRDSADHPRRARPR